MLIKVKVHPKAKEQKAEVQAPDSIKIWVKAKPERGEANQEVLQILSEHLQIPANQIRLIRGFRKRNKIFEIPDGISIPKTEDSQTQLFALTD